MSKRPHIIIFNPDEMRVDTMGHMGNPAARTPHLDRFVQEDAVSFRHTACQLCIFAEQIPSLPQQRLRPGAGLKCLSRLFFGKRFYIRL